MWIVGWCAKHSLEVGHAAAASENDPFALQTTAYAGDIQVTLALSPGAGTRRAVMVHLVEFGHRPAARTVTLGLSPLPGRVSTSQRMVLRGTTYGATVTMARRGSWHVLLQIRPEHVPSVINSVSFLVRWSAGRRLSASVVYPLFMPITGGDLSVSLPLGHFAATLRATIGAVGGSDFHIQLQPVTKGAHPPSVLHLQMRMLDMATRQTDVTAHDMGHGRYTADAFFSMPGAWNVEMTIQGSSTSTALVIGERVYRSQTGRIRNLHEEKVAIVLFSTKAYR